METWLIGIYFFLFFLPNLIINFLQYRHIQKAMTKQALLLCPSDYLDAGKYAIAKLRLGFIEDSINLITFIFWICFGLAWLNALFWDCLSSKITNWVLLILAFLLISQIISLPFKYYQEMILDKRFGFSKQTQRLFLIDFLKSAILLVIVIGVVLYALVALMSTFEYWWLLCAGFVLAIVVMINFLYPTWIAPLFNTFTPLQDANLQEKIETLMQQVGFESNGIFVMDASKRDGRLNAYFGGFGKSKRVVLFDTLLEKISSEGLIAILGHELGHFKHKDLIVNVLIQGVFLSVIFYIAGSLPTTLFIGLGLESTPDNILVLLFLIAPVISFWFLPLMGVFSRKAEFRADEFGASLSSQQALAQALVRLVNENKAFPSSHPLYICFHFTHPPLLERLRALNYAI